VNALPGSPARELSAWRARIVLMGLLACFVGLLGRDLYLQGWNTGFLQKEGDARYSRVIKITANRGIIADRNGAPLAISTPVESVWADPQDVKITPGQLRRLSVLLGMRQGGIRRRLDASHRGFVYLKRQLPPAQAAQVMKLGIAGIFLQQEYKRYYPAGAVAAHLIGFTNIDDKGQEGLELAYQNWLAGKAGSKRVIKDRLGHIVEDVESLQVPQEGRQLTLSIDRNIQYLAYRELKNAVARHHAKAGSIIVLNAKTGEVLALANQPSYNPNNRAQFDPNATRNRAITDAYEPGSTMKPFTIAAALDAGKVTPDTVIQTAPGTLTIGHATIHDADAHEQGALTVSQVIQVSSNVGAAKIALMLSPKYLWHMFHALGFGSYPHSGFPGESAGLLRPYAEWRPIEQATMAFGNGISVSLLQLARAYTVFANGGVEMPISLLKQDKPRAGVRVFSAKSTAEVLRMLQRVVKPGGTGPLAQVAGYTVGGKTGTAHKVVNGKYAKDLYDASFIGLAPASRPQLIVAVLIDQPSGRDYYGGEVAAPVFSKVMAGALRILGIPPDAPNQRPYRPGEVPLVKEVT